MYKMHFQVIKDEYYNGLLQELEQTVPCFSSVFDSEDGAYPVLGEFGGYFIANLDNEEISDRCFQFLNYSIEKGGAKTENLIVIGPLMKRTQPFKIIAGHMILLINILIIISYKNSEDFKPGDPELFDWGVPATIAIINTIGALILILLILSLIGKIAIETSTN